MAPNKLPRRLDVTSYDSDTNYFTVRGHGLDDSGPVEAETFRFVNRDESVHVDNKGWISTDITVIDEDTLEIVGSTKPTLIRYVDVYSISCQITYTPGDEYVVTYVPGTSN